MSESGAWLQNFLEHATAERWCTKIYCTTCGAWDFRLGLHHALDLAMGRARSNIRGRALLQRGYTLPEAEVLAAALAGVDFDAEPLRMILFELHLALSADQMAERIEPLLAGSRAGEVYQGMQWHHTQRVAERSAHEAFNAPEAVAARRAAKRQAKAEAHAARLEAKKARDRAWRAGHPRSD